MATLVTVLGMHRSGTSATTGTLQAYGVELGPASEENPFNPRGNREIGQLRRLHDRILSRSGGSWWDPPEEVAISDRHCASRDEILASIPGRLIGVKDPRMLVVLDLWRELRPAWIGVIRNPVAVCASLRLRAQERGKPSLSPEEWEALWRRYNRNLLEELEREPFPIVDFDRAEELDEQVRDALAFHRIEPRGDSSFYDPGLVSGQDGEDWRSRVLSRESLELWDQLCSHSEVSL